MVIRRTAVLPQPCWLHCSALEADACTEAKWKISLLFACIHTLLKTLSNLCFKSCFTQVFIFTGPLRVHLIGIMLEKMQEAIYTMDE